MAAEEVLVWRCDSYWSCGVLTLQWCAYYKLRAHYVLAFLSIASLFFYNNLNSPSRYFALIPAAGVGARMAAGCPKQYLHIAGQSILQHSVNAFLEHTAIEHVYVVVGPDDAYVASELRPDPHLTVLFCGGATRTDSVLNGLLAMQTQLQRHDWVLVHDAARPGINPTLIGRLIDQVGNNEVGGLLAIPVADTVKLKSGSQITTVPRTGLWLAQTPQMFRLVHLIGALNHARLSGIEITDEASAIEASGAVPVLVEGHWCNSKITRPDDLTLVESVLKKSV